MPSDKKGKFGIIFDISLKIILYLQFISMVGFVYVLKY
jgi:hypothetical protein